MKIKKLDKMISDLNKIIAFSDLLTSLKNYEVLEKNTIRIIGDEIKKSAEMIKEKIVR